MNLALEPGEKTVISNPFRVLNEECRYNIVVRVFDMAEHEVAHEQFEYPYTEVLKHASSKVSIVEDYLNIGIIGDGFAIKFAKNRGLTSMKIEDEEMIRTVPKPNFFRASTNNDIENKYGYRYAAWLSASMFSIPKFTKIIKNETFCEVHFDYLLPNLGGGDVHVVYTVYGDGELAIDMSYMPSEDFIEMPAFGMMFGLYKNYDDITYLGRGPLENYIDRNKGAVLGKYTYKASENVTPYLYPQECGNRTGVNNITISSGKHSLIIKGNNFEFSAIPYTPFEMENAKHADELPSPYQTVLCIYERQMGVAGDDTWGAKTHDEYLLSNSKEHRLSISIKGK